MSASQSGFFIPPEAPGGQVEYTLIVKMEVAFKAGSYQETEAYRELVLKEIELDRKYCIHNSPTVSSIIEKSIKSREEKTSEIHHHILQHNLLIKSPNPTPHHGFSKPTTAEEELTEHTPLQKMEAAFTLGNFQGAYDYGELVLKEVELDKKYYVEKHLFVPSSIRASINSKAARACVALGYIYQKGTLENITQDVATAEKYYSRALDDFGYHEAGKYLRALKESDEYTRGMNISFGH